MSHVATILTQICLVAVCAIIRNQLYANVNLRLNVWTFWNVRQFVLAPKINFMSVALLVVAHL